MTENTIFPSREIFEEKLYDIFKKNSLDKYLDTDKADKLYKLAYTLVETNKSLNLTAVTDADGIILKHFADSLIATDEFPEGASVIDVGCGGGFPTFPLAIVRPDLKITALDSTEKKINFVAKTAKELSLDNITAISDRAEDLGKGKLREMRELLADLGIEVLSQREAGFDIEVEETGTTFKENAVIKAEYIAYKTNKIVIADDSGLCVHALNDFPGIYSARFMEDKPYSEKHKEINKRLESHEDKSAHYTCAIAFVDPSKKICEVFEGKCFGTIINPIEGPHGFGYDPIFVPNGKNQPFSLIPEEEKNKISQEQS